MRRVMLASCERRFVSARGEAPILKRSKSCWSLTKGCEARGSADTMA